jgi:glutamate dehydrogenase
VWFLRNFSQSLDIDATMAQFAGDIQTFRAAFLKFISPPMRENYDRNVAHFTAKGVPARLAGEIAALEAMSSTCSIISASHATKLSVEAVGKIYYDIGARLELGWLRQKATEFTVDSEWDKIAIKQVVADLYDEQRRLSLAILRGCAQQNVCMDLVESWQERNRALIERYLRLIADIRATEHKDVSMLFVALKQLRAISVG